MSIEEQNPVLTADLAARQAKRHACEVDYVLGLPSRERRAAYLAAVREHRGDACAEALARAVRALWAARGEAARAQLRRMQQTTLLCGRKTETEV